MSFFRQKPGKSQSEIQGELYQKLRDKLTEQPQELSPQMKELRDIYRRGSSPWGNNGIYQTTAQSSQSIPEYFRTEERVDPQQWFKYSIQQGPTIGIRRSEKKVKDAVFQTLVLTVDGNQHEVVWFEGEALADVLERMAQSMR